MVQTDLPWHWYSPEMAERWWPAPEAVEETPSPDEVAAALAATANDRSQVLVVVGFAPCALRIIADDPTLASKDVVWIVRPGMLGMLTGALLAGESAGATATIGVWESETDIPSLVERLPLLCWSLAVLDGAAETIRRFQYWRTQRLYSSYFVLERTFTDLAHLLHREDRLAGAIPLRHWRGRYAGHSALCVAAGPSVDRHLDMIRSVQDRSVVICADIMHRRLANVGIRVDFVVNVDSHELLSERIPPTMDPETVLVMPLNGHRDLDLRIPRRTYTCDDPFGAFLLGDGGGFTTGTNVGCATLGFASWLGCAEAVLVGHDLSFTESCYYSSMVADRDGIEERSHRVSRGVLSEVDGNDGGKVLTNPGFRMGIRDLSMLIEHVGKQMRVYNPNIGLGIGALIPGAKALPADWQPLGVGACPRPGPCPVIAPVVRSGRLAQIISDQADRYLESWPQELEAADGDAIAAFAAIGDRPDLRMVHHLAVPVLMSHIAQLFRLSVLPSMVSTAHQRAVTTTAIADLLRRWRADLATVIATKECRPAAAPNLYTSKQNGFFIGLRRQVPVLPPWSLDEALLPLIARDWRCLVEAWPDLELPAPLSFYDGLQICGFLGERTPHGFLLQSLAHCAIDIDGRVDYALGLAVANGIMEEGAFSGDGRFLIGSHTCIEAVRACLSLGSGTSMAPLDDARLAAAWPPGWINLARRVLSGALPDSTRWQILSTLVGEGRIIPDDAFAEVVISRHADIPAACELLQPFEGSFGEGVTIAMARRMAEMGDYSSALLQCGQIRPLSILADEAWPLAMDCLVRLGRTDEIGDWVNRLPAHGLRVRALHRFLVRHFGARMAALQLAQQDLAPVPTELLAVMLLQATPNGGRDVDRELLGAVAGMARAAALHPCRRQDMAARLTELLEVVSGLERLAQGVP